MKRGILFILFLKGFFLLHGQNPVNFGAKAGVSLANQRYRITPIEYTMETSPVTGPAFSLFAETFRGDHFSFQADISYSVKGSRSSTRSVTVNHLDNDRITVNEGAETKSIFRYLSFAPMARCRTGHGSFVPYLLLGPRIDILLKYSSDSDYPLSGQNSTIFGLICGGGLEYSLRKMGIFAEMLYLPDLSPVTGEDPLLVRNHLVSLTLGVRWMSSR